MNILYIYNLFLSGTCRTVQSLGSIQVGKGDNEKFRLVISKSFRFITIAMLQPVPSSGLPLKPSRSSLVQMKMSL